MTPDPLAGLRDWHAPEPVSWWPLAPGWWLLAAILLVLILLAVRWLVRRHRASSLKRAARRELEALRQGGADQDPRLCVARLSRLLRRIALVRYPRERVAGLSGQAWLEFLDGTGGQGAFTRGAGRLLIEGAYRPAAFQSSDLEALTDVVARWVETNVEPGTEGRS